MVKVFGIDVCQNQADDDIIQEKDMGVEESKDCCQTVVQSTINTNGKVNICKYHCLSTNDGVGKNDTENCNENKSDIG